MIGRFRDRTVFRQVLLTATSGLLIALSWLFHWFYPQPAVEAGAALLAAALCGGPIILEALKGLWAREVNVDELVSLAILAAVVSGEFLTAATVSFIMVLGSLLEAVTAAHARAAIESLAALTPDKARLLAENGAERMIAVEDVKVGQRVLVKPGEKIPVDGQVLEGAAAVDQASITGESLPVAGEAGAQVYAGSFVEGGALVIEASRVGQDSTLGKIVTLIEQAESHQAQVVRSADAFAKWFTPVILLISGSAWWWSGDFMRFVAVLVVGCPCALILATPTAVVAAMGAAAKRGVMIKGGQFLEACAEVDAVAFDKTGTLTEGRPTLQQIHTFSGLREDEVLSLAAALEQRSEHPLAAAVLNCAKARGLAVEPVSNFQSIAGMGVSGVVGGEEIHVGREEFLGHVLSPSLEQRNGSATLWVSRAGQCVGQMSFEDTLRDDAANVVQKLQQECPKGVYLYSGDRPEVVDRISAELGIGAGKGGMLPHEKVAELKRIASAGDRVMYVGDGVNDGPALAASFVGVAFGAGASPLALETAPIAVLNPDLNLLPELLQLGRRTRSRIRENLFLFALLYNGAAILLASAGVLSPIMGAVAHNIGSVAVVLNSARLVRWQTLPRKASC